MDTQKGSNGDLDGARPEVIDPNPAIPPLVEEITQFRQSCCLRMTLFHEMLRRRFAGIPAYAVDLIREEANEFGSISYAYVECQGYRPYMEDRHIAARVQGSAAGLYTVLDGHGLEGEGHIVADYASRHFASIVDRHLVETAFTVQDAQAAVKEMLDRAITDLDSKMRRTLPMASENNGSTLTGVIVKRDVIAFMNLGDSRGALVSDDYSICFVTLDHKPTVPSEERRVLLAGGFIDDFRVNGDLAVSRTIGDSTYKPQNAARRLCPISNEPDVTLIQRDPNHRFILLASDGLWDALTTAEVVAIFKKYDLIGTMAQTGVPVAQSKEKIAEVFKVVLKEATRRRLSSDNLTLFVVLLDGGPSSIKTSSSINLSSDAAENQSGTTQPKEAQVSGMDLQDLVTAETKSQPEVTVSQASVEQLQIELT